MIESKSEKEYLRELHRKQKHREHSRKYRETHPDKIREQSKRYRETRSEMLRLKQGEYSKRPEVK